MVPEAPLEGMRTPIYYYISNFHAIVEIFWNELFVFDLLNFFASYHY